MTELDSKALDKAYAVFIKVWMKASTITALNDAVAAYLSALPAPATQEVDELREDTARLDWLEMRVVTAVPLNMRSLYEFVHVVPPNDAPSDLRAQIDRARAAEKDAS